MDKKDDVFLKKLLATFKIEAREHIAMISSGLLEIEKVPPEKQKEIVETIFREAHSLKGAARAVNMADIESLCGSLETVFASLKRKEITVTRNAIDILHTALDTLGKLVESSESRQTTVGDSVVREVSRTLENMSKAGVQHPEQQELRGVEAKAATPKPTLPTTVKEDPEPSAEKRVGAETTRISKAKLDSILLQAEGFLSARQAAGQRCAELRDVISEVSLSRKKWSRVRDDIRAIRNPLGKDGILKGELKKNSKFPNLIGFIESSEDLVKALHSKLAVLEKSLEQDKRSLGTMVDGLLDDVKKAAMFPFSSLLEIFPRIVRDISHSQGKEAELVVRGGDIEIDRRILEEMKDPLVHLVRNCIDHGIEKPEERMMKKKPSAGTITIAISHLSGKKAEILVSDDGSGIDIDRIRSSAVKVGLLSGTEAEKLEDEKIIPFIFHSGVTTTPIITDISGRGLGLAIVLEKVEKLRGAVSCASHPGEGTTFRIELPLSIAAFRGVLVRVDEQLFILPTAYLERVMRARRDEIKTVENRETIVLNGRIIPLVSLGAVLELPGKAKRGGEKEFMQLAVLASAGKHIAVSVDEIINEEEVLVKDLGRQLSRVRNVAGSTVLGTGKVVPILTVPDLLKSAVRVSATAGTLAEAQETPAERKSLLVVEDSITSRTLLKNILEGAGYDVRTAVDGVDAFTALRTGEFDLVVSDIDMPRMNGFDLTSKIRADRKLAELPVVLVTALESREDRGHGIDVGANAYIVKSSFDQSNLLEVLRRLI